MPADEYRRVWTLDVRAYTIEGGKLSITLEDSTLLSQKIELPTWKVGDLDAANFTYPRLAPSARGRHVSATLGILGGVECTPIDVEGKEFRIGFLPLTRLVAVRTDGGSTLTPVGFNAADTTFTLPDWDGTATIVADVEGPQVCGPDIIEKLLDLVGWPSALIATPAADIAPLHRVGFGQYGARLDHLIGHTPQDADEVMRPALGLLIKSLKKLDSLIEEIELNAGLRFWVDADGSATCRVWGPDTSDGALILQNADVYGEVNEDVDNDALISAVLVRYRHDQKAGTWQTVRLESEELRRRHRWTAHRTREIDSLMWDRGDGLRLASRELATGGEPVRVVEVDTTSRALQLSSAGGAFLDLHRPGPFGSVITVAKGFWEVLTTSIEDSSGAVKARFSDWFGVNDHAHVAPDAPVLFDGTPADQWDPDWSDEQKDFAAENFAYVADGDTDHVTDRDPGTGAPEDPDSYRRTKVSAP